MAIFLTGSTGYIGAHVAANLLEGYGASLNLLVRARDPAGGRSCASGALSNCIFHFPAFFDYVQSKCESSAEI